MGFQTMDFDEFAKELEELGDVDRYAPALLNADTVLGKRIAKRSKTGSKQGLCDGRPG